MTIAMPSTTPLQVTSQGSSPPPCMAQLASRDKARFGVVGVYGGERAAVSGVEGLEQVSGFASSDLSHHDVIRAVAQARGGLNP